jgi:nicotinate phosphoribosyltransferase
MAPPKAHSSRLTAHGSQLVSNPLLTDLYELNMAMSYLRRGMNGPATFSLFIRELPESRGFLVAAGLDECLSYLEGYRFGEVDLTYLRTLGFDDGAIASFRDLTFTGDVWAVPEGRIAFANEPLLEVTAPLPEAQLVETFLLNQITLHTNLASKAARCRIAAGDRSLVDFSLRRTQGIEAGMAIARCSAIAGFSATSNVEAARRFGLQTSGTMAHSYVEAFPTEEEAFRAYVSDFPEVVTLLVDTYDTLQGVRTAADVITSLDHPVRASIRLDSGDIEALARAARKILDDAGLRSVGIFASGGLDELAVEKLVRDGAPIDGFGVGTKIGVAADSPYLESVYKLVEYDGRPVMKLSTGKLTAPGKKQVFRPPDMSGDILALRDEPAPEGYEPLLQPVMIDGKRMARVGDLEAAKRRFEDDLARLPAAARDLQRPRPPATECSVALVRLQDEVRHHYPR